MSGTIPFNPALRSSLQIAPTADIAALVQAAGGQPSWARYNAGTQTLELRGVSQEALDAAAVDADLLFTARVQKKLEAKAKLDQLIEDGMPWQGKVADIDEISTNRMTSVTVAAQTGLVTGGIPWRMKDNSALVLDPAGVVAMSSAAFAYIAALRNHYWSLADAAMSATDEAALAEIDTTAGWPDLASVLAPPPEPEPTP